MTYSFTIPGRLPSLNEYLKAERQTKKTPGGRLITGGAEMKKKWQKYINRYIRLALRGTKITKPVVFHYHYYEPDARRDLGNIHAVTQKFVEDSAQDVGLIPNDNQRYIKGFTADFNVDANNPRIVVEIEEL